MRREIAALPARLGARHGEIAQGLGVGGIGEFQIDPQLLVRADDLGQCTARATPLPPCRAIERSSSMRSEIAVMRRLAWIARWSSSVA